MMSHPSFWFNQALEQNEAFVQPALNADINSDICIVGGGYTGLWTAIKIKQRSPETQVCIIEKGVCGQGASGRNGGCMLTFATKFNTLKRLFGEQEASRLVIKSEQAVYDIRDFCLQHSIDAEIRVDGAIYTATNQAQSKQLLTPVKALQAHHINRWKTLSNQQVKHLSGSDKNIAGISTDAAGSLHPAKLVLGLKNVALNMGINIFEHSAMSELEQNVQPRVLTQNGSIRAKKVIMAINAWTGQHFKEFNKHYVLVSSDMLISKPQPELLKDIGLNHGKAIADSRLFVHYYRTTLDGRLMLGKGGNRFSYNNHMLAEFDQPSQFEPMLKQSFKAFFPSLKLDFEPSWNGASDRSKTGLPFFGTFESNNNILYGLGYSGNGVVQSYLGGDILSSMALGLDNEWTNSGLTKGPLGQFPPEPIRFFGSQLVKNAIQRKERFEDDNKSPLWLDKQLAKFAAAAGKADK